jgi:SAM-dependent methyltransferase
MGYQNLAGVDFSQGMIERGRRSNPGLWLEKMDGGFLPFPDGAFDAVILLAVLTCIVEDGDQFRLMSEVRRVLAPGGFLYLGDYLLNGDERNLERYEKFSDHYGNYGVFELPEGVLVRHHSKDHILGLLGGFRVLSFQETLYTTMNGHESNGFFLMAQKEGPG